MNATEKKENTPHPVELMEVVKEKGLGLKMPDESVLDVSDLSPGFVEWMKWVTNNIYSIRKNTG